MESHGNSFKYIDVSNDYSVDLFEIISGSWVKGLFSLKNEKLVGFGLVSDKFLTANDGKIFFVLAFLDC